MEDRITSSLVNVIISIKSLSMVLCFFIGVTLIIWNQLRINDDKLGQIRQQ